MQVRPKPLFQTPLATPPSSPAEQQALLKALGIDPAGTKAQALLAQHGHTLYLTFKGSQAPLVLKDEGPLGMEVHKAARGKGQKVDHPLPQGFGELALALANAAPAESLAVLAVALDCPAPPAIWTAVDEAFVIAQEACQPTTTIPMTTAATTATTTTTTLSTSPVTTTTTLTAAIAAAVMPLTTYALSEHRAAMVKAIDADQPREVLAVLMRAPLLNAGVLEGATPLQLAARLGKLQVLDYLLDHPDVAADQTHPQGMTALHEAAAHGQLGAVERLLKKTGVNARLPLPSGATPFYLAIENGHLEVAQRLLAHDRTQPTMPGLVLRRMVDKGATPLHAACQQGTWATVQWLLGLEGTKVQQADHEGRTPLAYAIQNGHLPIADLLVAKGADIHPRAKDGSTLLHVACAGGHYDALLWVLRQPEALPHEKAKGDASHRWNQTTRTRETPLSLAVQSGNARLVEFLLRQESIKPNPVDANGDTPLYKAVQKGDLGIVEALLTHARTDVNRVCRDDVTPFLLAAAIGSLDMVKLLFPRTNLHLRNHDGDTAVYAACLNLRLETVQWLLQQPETLTHKGKKIGVAGALNKVREGTSSPLLAAIQKGKGAQKLVRFLLAQPDIDVNLCPPYGVTPLHQAIQMGLRGITHQLLRHPDIVVDADALEVALAQGQQPIAKLLCDQWKADIHHVNGKGKNALHLACKSGDLHTVEWVLGRLAIQQPDGHRRVTPAVLNARDKDGATPLYRAVRVGHRQIVQRLLDMPGIDPNAPDRQGDTPLHIALLEGEHDIIELLVTAPRMAIDQKNHKGDTALHMAVVRGALEAIEQLLDAGADIHLPNKAQLTPLQLACDTGRLQVVRLLLRRPEIRLLNGQPHDLPAVLGQTTPEGKTLLRLAIQEEGAELVLFLLAQKGIDPNRVAADGRSPLHAASRKGNAEAVSALLAHPETAAVLQDRHGYNVLSWIRNADTAAAVVKAVQDGVAPQVFRALAQARNPWGSQAASVLAQHGVEGDVIRMLPVTPVKKPLKLPTTTYRKGWVITGGGQPDWDNNLLVQVGAKARIPMETCGDGRVDLSWKTLNELPIQPGDVVVCQFKCFLDLKSKTHMAFLGQGEVAPWVEVARLMFEKGALRALLMRTEVTDHLFSDAVLTEQFLGRFRNDPNLPRAADPKSEYLGLDYTSVSSHLHLSSFNLARAAYWLRNCERQRENPAAAAPDLRARSVLPMTTFAWNAEQKTLGAHSHDVLEPKHLAQWSGPQRRLVCTDLVFGCFAVREQDNGPGSGNFVKLVSLLEEHQADPNAQDVFGRTALHLACTRGWVAFAELLHKHGAKLDLRDRKGRTPMALACAHGHGQMVEWLLKKGVPADQATPTGHPLLIAIERGHVHVVRLLLDAGAHPETRDLQGRTALELAKTLPNREIAQMLQERPASGSTTTTTTTTTVPTTTTTTTTTTGATTTTTQTDTRSTTLAGPAAQKN